MCAVIIDDTLTDTDIGNHNIDTTTTYTKTKLLNIVLQCSNLQSQQQFPTSVEFGCHHMQSSL